MSSLDRSSPKWSASKGVGRPLDVRVAVAVAIVMNIQGGWEGAGRAYGARHRHTRIAPHRAAEGSSAVEDLHGVEHRGLLGAHHPHVPLVGEQRATGLLG